MNETIDIKENEILNIDASILEILLKDHTTNKNIIWGTQAYKTKGYLYEEKAEMLSELITGKNGKIIRPRVSKSFSEQQVRIKKKAEVFTPSWVCNVQNNLIDEEWFGMKNVFNVELNEGWKSVTQKIRFIDKEWTQYIEETRLEVSCGEAPYLVSRYDTVTGNRIEIIDRIGLLDRKLRVICENVDDEDEWIKWAKIAYQSVYGYDYQGDNVLIARENLLYTLIDYYYYKFKKELNNSSLIDFANIISWNIWQMDGLKFVVPLSCKNDLFEQINLFGEKIKIGIKCSGCEKGNIYKHNGKKCYIMDWKKRKKVKYISLLGG